MGSKDERRFIRLVKTHHVKAKIQVGGGGTILSDGSAKVTLGCLVIDITRQPKLGNASVLKDP